jgi:hypothetical protein
MCRHAATSVSVGKFTQNEFTLKDKFLGQIFLFYIVHVTCMVNNVNIPTNQKCPT